VRKYETAELQLIDGTWVAWPDMPIRLYADSEAIVSVSWSRFDDLCIERGVNLFDTADVYSGGESEVILGKALGGGVLPVSAFVGRRELMDTFTPGSHGSTFGGNPLACAAANAAIRYMEDFQLAQRAQDLGQEFMAELRTIDSPKIREVRGLGLIVGIELKEKAGPYIQQLMERGILVLGAGPTVIRYLPPLVIERDDLKRVAAETAAVLQ
jgi:acetylornithine/succinyldiaminopimelate/putrescine aminotransferase